MEYIPLNLRIEFREFCVGLFLRQIDDIFQMADIELGKAKREVNGAKRSRVEDYYASINWTDIADIQKFLTVLGLVLSQSDLSSEGRDFMKELCIQSGLTVEGYQVRLSKEASYSGTDDLFIQQFPGGLPFGTRKPDLAVSASRGTQSLKFEMASGIGILWQDIYPNFDFLTFQSACGIDSGTNLALKTALLNMNQTSCEKKFFQTYARYFNMAEKHIPMLVPQAWVQWHSSSKRLLKAAQHPLANELYRIDFVAFWEDQRYAILVDDISHYAVKRGNLWIADEAAYSKGIEEDRKLQAEGWNIFRVSNWEIKQARLNEIILDLQKFIRFEA